MLSSLAWYLAQWGLVGMFESWVLRVLFSPHWCFDMWLLLVSLLVDQEDALKGDWGPGLYFTCTLFPSGFVGDLYYFLTFCKVFLTNQWVHGIGKPQICLSVTWICSWWRIWTSLSIDSPGIAGISTGEIFSACTIGVLDWPLDL
jgi:hypothetical protein